MSVPVSLDRLREEAERFGPTAYLLTVGDAGRAHVVSAAWSWEGDELVFRVGRRTGSNAGARPLVSVLWPPREADGYNLIVDADARLLPAEGDDAPRVALRPTTAVLHRSALVAVSAADLAAGACGNDCIPLG